jgi:Rieske Fe-S protein
MPGEPGRVSRRSVIRASGAVAVGGVAAMGAAAVGCANSGSFDPTVTAGSPTGVLIPLDEVPVGGVAAVTIDRRPAFIARPTVDSVRAFSAVCTHRSCTVVVAGDILLCPCHRSHFALLTGEVLRGPAEKPLPAIDVAIDEGSVIRG